MPTGLRQLAREFYVGTAGAASRIPFARGESRGARATISFEGTVAFAAGSDAASSTDNGLIATDVGGRRTMGAPLGNRSGCALYAASRATCRVAATLSTREKYTSEGVNSARPEC